MKATTSISPLANTGLHLPPMSKQTSLGSFFNKSAPSTPEKPVGYLAQLRSQIKTDPAPLKSTVLRKDSPQANTKKRSIFDANNKGDPLEKDRPPKKQKVVQTSLDLGQDLQRKCLDCGMLYSPGNEEDEAVHKKFHAKKTALITFNGFKNQPLADEWDDGSYVTYFTTNETKSFIREKLQQIQEMVNQQLGFGASSSAENKTEKVFIYVFSKKVVGCAIFETIDGAFQRKTEKPDKNDPSNQIVPMEIPPEEAQEAPKPESPSIKSLEVNTNAPTVAVLGISRIWVAPKYRRRGIATKLLEAGRNSFVYGAIVPKAQVAFSQPTEDGLKLATEYFGKEDFSIYTP